MDKFVSTLLKSGLLDDISLRDARRAVDVQTAGDANLEQLCSHLASNELLTQWQCDKLRLGRCRGFFIDNFKLMQPVGEVDCCTTYMAEDANSGMRIGLRITWPGDGVGSIEYELVDLTSSPDTGERMTQPAADRWRASVGAA